MNIEKAIKILDEVIPAPINKMVDSEHLAIAVAWRTIKEEIERLQSAQIDYDDIHPFFH